MRYAKRTQCQEGRGAAQKAPGTLHSSGAPPITRDQPNVNKEQVARTRIHPKPYTNQIENPDMKPLRAKIEATADRNCRSQPSLPRPLTVR